MARYHFSVDQAASVTKGLRTVRALHMEHQREHIHRRAMYTVRNSGASVAPHAVHSVPGVSCAQDSEP